MIKPVCSSVEIKFFSLNIWFKTIWFLIGFKNLKILILSQGNDRNPVCQNANFNEYIEGVLNIDENNYTNNNNFNMDYPPQTQIPIRNYQNMSLGYLNNNLNKNLVFVILIENILWIIL